MRSPGKLSQITGFFLLAVALTASVLIVRLFDKIFSIEVSVNVVNTLLFILSYTITMIATYRAFIHFFPLKQGEIPVASRQDFIYGVHCGFYLILFNALILTYVIPIPLKRLIFIALGARLGKGTYPAGFLVDGQFLEVGRDATIGAFSMLIPHVMEDDRLAYYNITLGDHVTVGMGSYILAGTVIEDHAIVAANSTVIKHTHIKRGEIWAGNPAKKIGERKDLE